MRTLFARTIYWLEQSFDAGQSWKAVAGSGCQTLEEAREEVRLRGLAGRSLPYRVVRQFSETTVVEEENR